MLLITKFWIIISQELSVLSDALNIFMLFALQAIIEQQYYNFSTNS